MTKKRCNVEGCNKPKAAGLAACEDHEEDLRQDESVVVGHDHCRWLHSDCEAPRVRGYQWCERHCIAGRAFRHAPGPHDHPRI